MTRQRTPAAQRRQESYDADRRAWERFQPELAAVRSWRDAVALLGEAAGPDAPGRRYYSNLGFFLQTFAPPAGANGAELHEYLRLIAAFDGEGLLKPGARVEVEGCLHAALTRGAGA